MSSTVRRLMFAFLMIGALTLVLLIFTGGASATPDSNNDFSEAIEVRNWSQVSGDLNDVDDWDDIYRIHLDSGECLDVSMAMGIGVDFDLYVYYENEMDLRFYSQDDNIGSGIYAERIVTDVPASGWYYIDVYAGTGQGDYSLLVRGMAEWTIMVYMDADNNLEAQGIADFLEMSSIGSTTDVNIVVQMDRISGYDTSYGDWTGTNRYRVEQGMVPDMGSSWENMGEQDMGSPSSLHDFLGWGYTEFPAHHYMLVLWDHGNNWKGICRDDTSSSMLAVSDVRSAIHGAETFYSGLDLDIIGFDACIMSSVEVYRELYDLTSYLVGSELNEPGPGWNYELSLNALVLDPTMSPRLLASQVADDYVYSYTEPAPGYSFNEVSMTVVDTNGMSAVIDALDDLSGDMRSHMGSQHNYYETARSNSASFYSDYFDLYDLASNVRAYAPIEQTRIYAWNLMNATGNATVFFVFNDPNGGQPAADARSMTIYFPRVDNYNGTYEIVLGFTSLTQWDEMLVEYFGVIATLNDPVSIASRNPVNDPTVAENTSINFSITANNGDSDTLVYYWYLDGTLQSASSSSVVWTPDATDIGAHTLEVEVWDGASWASSSWTVTVNEKADLIISDHYQKDCEGDLVDRVTSGRPLSAFINVTNAGETDATGFTVLCYIDTVPFCQWNLPSLSAGSSFLLETLPFTLSTLKAHDISFSLDTTGAVDESNEGNNSATFTIWVDPAKWTVLIYMDGDNNLERYMVDNFLQMAEVGSDADVSVVVQFDRVSGYDARYGDWVDCLRFYVRNGMTPTIANATQDLNEVNMGDGSTLESFLLWGTSNYQADRYIVVLKDHGSSWVGCCLDATSGGDPLDLREMSAAFRSMINETGAPIDLLVFDDCLMGSLEVAAEFGDDALYAVVSETVGWTSNYNYTIMLDYLVGNLQISSESLAIEIAEMIELKDDHDHTTQCVAVYDLTRVDALMAALEDYLFDLHTSWVEDPGYLQLSRGSCWPLEITNYSDAVDLYQFIENSMMFCRSAELNTTAQAVLDLLSASSDSPILLSCLNTPVADFCHGMSAYFPAWLNDFDEDYMDCGEINDVSAWPGMVRTYLYDGPPLTFIDLEGTLGEGNWYVSSVTVDFICHDPTYQGIDYLNYSFGGSWYAYVGPFVMSADGNRTISWYSTGANGAEEVVRSWHISIDRSAPFVSTVLDGYLLTFNVNDENSGVAAVYYRVGDGSWNEYYGQFSVGNPGWRYVVEYYAVDMAGNVGTVQSVNVGTDDTIAPVTSMSLGGTVGQDGWYVGTVTVTLGANDSGGSGLDGIFYRFGTSAWVRYTAPVLVSTTGTHAFSYYTIDHRGNTDSGSATIKADLVAPVSVSEVVGGRSNGWYNGSVSVRLNATDGGSGLSLIKYRTDGGAWTTYDSSFQISAEGSTLLEWYAMDVAGNAGSVNGLQVKIDSILPEVDMQISGLSATGWGNGTARCSLTAMDLGSGVGSIMYRVNQGPWSSYLQPFGFNATGEYLMECYAVDIANNTGEIVNMTIRVDVTAPVSLLSVTGLTNDVAYYNSVEVRLNATDVGGGPGSIWYRLDDGPWTLVASIFYLETAGAHVLWYFAEDVLGNTERVRSVQLTILEATVPDKVAVIWYEVSRGEIVLSWGAPDDGGATITAYKIYRSLNNGPMVLIATVNGTQCVDDNLRPGDEFRYEIVAENLLGEGTASEAFSLHMSSDSRSDPALVVIIVSIIVAAVGAAMFLKKKK